MSRSISWRCGSPGCDQGGDDEEERGEGGGKEGAESGLYGL